ncbi:MAG: T9SS type A sorting domain-containing protein [Ignavibacteria bacterium]
MKKLLVLLVMLTVMSNNLYSQMNFPLQVGNKFIYYYTYEYHYPGGGQSGNYRVGYQVIKDSLFNNKKYYLMNAYPHYSGTKTWVRFDSVTKSIYAFDSTNSCTYYFKEKLIDSLAMLAGTTNSCSYQEFNSNSIDTIYGIIGTTRSFRMNITTGYRTIFYNSNFGITKYEEFSFLGAYGHTYRGTLLGCYINGIKYGDTILTSIHQINSNSPTEFKLSQNYPNPFNPTTNIKFSIVNSGDVKLIVYDIQGREVQTLVNESLKPGTYEAAFDGSMLTSGVYFYKLVTDGFTETKRMVLIK